MYCKILEKNNYFIEALQLKNLGQIDLLLEVKPVSEQAQQKSCKTLNRKNR